jgi:hypothetical protein
MGKGAMSVLERVWFIFEGMAMNNNMEYFLSNVYVFF